MVSYPSALASYSLSLPHLSNLHSVQSAPHLGSLVLSHPVPLAAVPFFASFISDPGILSRLGSILGVDTPSTATNIAFREAVAK